MARHKSSVKFHLQTYPNKNGKKKINLIYRCHDATKKICTGIEVDPDWREKNCRDDFIIDALNNLRTKIRHIEKKLLEQQQSITASEVVLMLKKPQFQQTHDNICMFITHYHFHHGIKRNKEYLKENMLLRDQLLEWGDDITFMQMNHENILNFESWIKEQGFTKNAINLIMRSLIAVMKIADEISNLEVHQSYKLYKPAKRTSDDAFVSLTESEIELLKNAKGLGRGETMVRDMFLFACGSGLKYSDLILLEWKDIRRKISMNGLIKWVLERNKLENYPTPHCSNQFFNRKINGVCQKAGINSMVKILIEKDSELVIELVPKYKLIQFYTGRITFATLFSENNYIAT